MIPFYFNEFGELKFVFWLPLPMVLTKIAADTVADVIEVPLAFSGTVIAHIQYGGKEKMILTMPLAVPLATRPSHTHTHTQAHTQHCFPSLEELRSRHMCLPQLLLRKKQWKRIYSCRGKHSHFLFYKTTLSHALYFLFCFFLYFGSLSSFPFSSLFLIR